MVLKYFNNLSRRNKKLILGIALLVNDIFFLSLSFFLSYYLRFYTNFFNLAKPTYSLNEHYLIYSIIFICITLIFFGFYKLYDWDKLFKGSGYYFRIFKAISINIIIIIIIGYIFETFSFSRIWIGLLYIFSVSFIIISRFCIELLARYLIRKMHLESKTAIIGIGEMGRRIYETLKNYSIETYNIVGFIDKEDKIKQVKEVNNNFYIIGNLENLTEVIKNNSIEKIIISSNEFNNQEILDIIDKLRDTNTLVLMFPGFFDLSIKKTDIKEAAGIPLIQISKIGFFGLDLFLKRAIDYTLGSFIFILFIPIYLVTSVLIKIDSKGPVFYKQVRLTKDFREFEMYKFRTMYVDADKKLDELREKNITNGPIFKMKNDPRVTRIGRILRKFSIDEMPQILNVLKGDLSLVGPRPPIPSEVEKYEEWQKKRLSVKQGVTGLWQISGRSNLSFEEMVRLDLYYIQNWSIGMDIKIIIKTIPVIFLGRGAY